MTKFVVLLHTGMNQAVIALDGYEPNDGSIEVGSFEMDVDPMNQQTNKSELGSGSSHEHPYITRAKEVLAESEDFHGNVDRVTFLDKASNAPVHPETTLSTDDQMDGEKVDDDLVNKERTDTGGEPVKDGDNDGDETIDQLKERLKGVTDKSALEADYKAEQEGKNRAGAIAAYEARATELDTPAA